MRNTRLLPTIEGGMLVTIAVLLTLAGEYIPGLDIVTQWLTPVPIAILGIRYGLKWSVLATFVMAVLIAVLFHPLQSVMVIATTGFLGIFFGHAFRVKYSPEKTIIIGAFISFVSTIIIVLAFMISMGFNPILKITQLQMFIDDVFKIDEIVKSFQQQGFQGEQLENIKTMLTYTRFLIMTASPALILISSMARAGINFWILRKILNRLGHSFPGIPPFALWQLPKFFAWMLIGSVLLLWFGNTQGLQITKDIAINFLFVSAIALFVQGIALLWFVFAKYNVNKFFRAIILLLVFFNGFFTQMVVFAGVFDAIFDYRKLKSRK